MLHLGNLWNGAGGSGRVGALCGNMLLSATASAESFRLRTVCTVSQMPIMAAMSFYSGFPEVHFTIWQLYIGNLRMIVLIEVIIFLKENLKKVIRYIHGFCSYSTYVRCIIRLCLFTVLFFFSGIPMWKFEFFDGM